MISMFPVKKSTRRQVSYSWISRNPKAIIHSWQPWYFVSSAWVLISWFAWGRQNLMNEIRNAFYGSGSPLLEKMMGNKEVLSVGVYLNKALTLSNWLIYFMVLIMALCVIGFLYIKYSEYFHKILLHVIQMDLQQSNGDFGNSDNCASWDCFPELDEGGYCHARQPV